MTRAFRILLGSLALAAVSPVAAAQQPSQPLQQGIPSELACVHREIDTDKYSICRELVEFVQGDTKLYADEMEWFKNEDRVVARGNVAFFQGRNHIAADRADRKSVV